MHRFCTCVYRSNFLQWLREIDLIFDMIECSNQEKHKMATFQLTHAAADWWESKRSTLGEEAIPGMT